MEPNNSLRLRAFLGDIEAARQGTPVRVKWWPLEDLKCHYNVTPHEGVFQSQIEDGTETTLLGKYGGS